MEDAQRHWERARQGQFKGGGPRNAGSHRAHPRQFGAGGGVGREVGRCPWRTSAPWVRIVRRAPVRGFAGFVLLRSAWFRRSRFRLGESLESPGASSAGAVPF